MNVLFLGPSTSEVFSFLRATEEVATTAEPLGPEIFATYRPEFLVSHGYRYLVPPAVVQTFRDHAINLHISLLPWNRGADPNLWSFIDDTPKGVTIHYVDEGLDTGDIIVQKEVNFSDEETLRTSYAKLQDEILHLFREWWPPIRRQACPRQKQDGPGSYHRARDKAAIMHLLANGWDTSVAALKANAPALQRSSGGT
jgi:methionyl-tRNA formyltransferase